MWLGFSGDQPPSRSPHRVTSTEQKMLLVLFFFYFGLDHFKLCMKFITILLLFYVLVFWPRGMWDLRSPTRGGTLTPCIRRRILGHFWPGKSFRFQLLQLRFNWTLMPCLSEVFLYLLMVLGNSDGYQSFFWRRYGCNPDNKLVNGLNPLPVHVGPSWFVGWIWWLVSIHWRRCKSWPPMCPVL